jgi:ribonuclease G
MKKILISSDRYETRVAIVEEGVVVETYIERDTRRSMLGNVYLSRVDNVLPGMEAAFIDAGLPKNGFLYVNEIVIPELDDKERRKKRIQELIRPGQELLVQVVKDPMGTKGARVTMQLSFAGRFLVFSPEGTGNGVSKRLEDAERERLRGLVKKLKPRNGGGLIVRTAARGAELPELERDLRLLEDQWEAIQAAAAAGRAPALVHQEVDLALEMVRDDLRVDVDEVVTDDPATFERITAYVQQHSPRCSTASSCTVAPRR